MAPQLKKLYMCKCLAELQEKAKSVVTEGRSAKVLLKSADTVFAEAEKKDGERDEECAYVFYFRYLELVSAAQKKEDFKNDRVFFEKLLSKSRMKKAIERLEKLTDSLHTRYDILKDIESFDSQAKQKEYNDALENVNKIAKKSESGSKGTLSSGDSIKASLSSLNGIVKPNGVDKFGEQNAGITPNELKNLLEQRTQRILLVDCRDQFDFSTNRINHSNCICIPAIVLTDGMSADKILKKLKESNPESYMDWHNRTSFDYIVLYDWNSSFDNRQHALNIVYDAVTKWDPGCKNVKIRVIQGGMKSMYYAYPFLLTNPQTGVNSTSKFNGNGTTAEPTDLRKLDSISYPDLEDNPPKPKPVKPMSATEPRENNLSGNTVRYSSASSAVNNHHHQPPDSMNNGQDVPKKVSGLISVDRSTKPTRLPSSSKIPNGSLDENNVMPSVNHTEEVPVSVGKTDEKVKEYSKALDAVIESSKELEKVEKEAKELRELVRNQQFQNDKDLEEKLKAKEVENDNLSKIIDRKNEEVARLKAQYEAVLREQKAKTILPPIRTSTEEEEISAKLREKEKLDEVVRELRKIKVRDNITIIRKDDPVKPDVPRGGESISKLPPIPTNSANSLNRVPTGTAPSTQLPVISTPSLPQPPASGVSSASVNLKPSSVPTTSSVSSSVSRPASQDASGITRQKLKDENSDIPRSSALKRSHSHPNIAQSHDDDMSDDSGSQPPRINRGLKPTSNRTYVPEVNTTPRRFARNFEVVSSTEKSKTGLKNLGNTCYMNSIIQCLSHTTRLVDYLRNEEYLKEWHPQRSSTKGEATEELAAAVKQMHSGHRSISLRDLKSTIGKHHFSFRGFEQQDSHEFITILLDWLHEEMNRVPEKTPLKEQKNDGLTDEIASARAFEDYKRSNNSKISELFCGQQKSCVTCGNCSRQSVTFEPFFILSVPIPSSGKRCDIQQCIDFYTTEEELSGWNCVHCKKKVRATKKIDLWRLPPYLIIHLQRFYFDGYWKKRLTEIDFPVENLNLNQKALGRECNIIDKCPSYNYQLYGVSNHYGTMDSGHYTAYCRQPGLGSWFKFDDQEVCPINSRDVPTAAAYILFYQNHLYC